MTQYVDPAMWPSFDERDLEPQHQNPGHPDCVAHAEDTPAGLRVWFDVREGFGFQNIEHSSPYVRPLQPRGPDRRVL